ncbi:uncharacterized protein LOC135825249 [Sycon ciliatum]|uniref:uncharacterized protein LOC135815035 n=1 Tax=Sycon ciliatum TaxID=27933 RepID=UPI0031F6BC1D
MSAKKVSSLADLRVPELKRLLREHGLPLSGKKDELIGRLKTFAKTSGRAESSFLSPPVQGNVSNPPAQSQPPPIPLSTESIEVTRTKSKLPVDPNLWKPLVDIRTALPMFTMANMVAYFIYGQSTDGSRMNFKAVNEHALLLFSNGLVQAIKGAVDPEEQGTMYLRCIVLAEMKQQKTYTLYMKLDRYAEVLYAECGCPAGRPPHASCKHLAAFAYALEEFVRLGYHRSALTCTEEASKWNVPRSKKVEVCLLKDLVFKKAAYSKSSATPVAAARKELDKPLAPPRLPSTALLTFAKNVNELSTRGVAMAFTHVLPSESTLVARVERIARAKEQQQACRELRAEGTDKASKGASCEPSPSGEPSLSGEHSPSGEPDTQLTREEVNPQSLMDVTGNASDNRQVQEYPLPWGGSHRTEDGKQFYFSNTCPLDNGLMFCFTLLSSNDIYIHEFRDAAKSGNRAAHALLDMCGFIDIGEPGAAKYIWWHALELLGLPRVPCDGQNINFYGSEADRFVIAFNQSFCLPSVSYECDTCNVKKDVVTPEIFISADGDLSHLPGPDQVKVMLNAWFFPGSQPCRCGGVRSYSRRRLQVLRGSRVGCSVAFFCCICREMVGRHTIYSAADFPLQVEVPGTDSGRLTAYRLLGVTYGNGQHFVSHIHENGTFYFYDGMNAATGGRPQAVVGPPVAPAGYQLGHIMYAAVVPA